MTRKLFSGGGSRNPKGTGEPQRGFYQRTKAFMEERLAKLEPTPSSTTRGAGKKKKSAEKVSHYNLDCLYQLAPPDEAEKLPSGKEKGTLPDGFYRECMKEYRKRCKKKAPKKKRRTGAPPEAPATPPADNWVAIGPSVLRKGQAATKPATSGRTPAICPLPGGTRIYIGAANGGVWRSEDTGKTWHSLMDAFDLNPINQGADTLSVGAMAVVPGATAATDRIYVGSGEGPGGAYLGVGPLISTDGGANWATEPVSPGSTSLGGQRFWAMEVDPADSDRVVGVTSQRLYRREPDGSGGFHWDQKTLPSPTLPGILWYTSVVVARDAGTTTFFAAPWRGPVYSSTDGDTWTTLGTGFPTANVGRITLACQADNPDLVYALIMYWNGTGPDSNDGSLLGVWVLDTSVSNTWRQIGSTPSNLFGTAAIGFQGSYDQAVTVAPNDGNLIYLGGSTVNSGGEWSGSVYRCSIARSGSVYTATPTYIGGSCHADIHKLVFTPGDASKLWVGCDGGVFYATSPTGSGNIFEAKNTGLATLTMEHLAQHPTEDAVVFCGTQDNGGVRFTGEAAWLHSVWGDAGYPIINWNDPYKVLSTYVRAFVNRATDGGTRYNYSAVNVPIGSDQVLFYAPLVGTPYNPGAPAEAERVAFGSTRPWISDTFGGGWQSIPNNNTTDRLGTGNDFRIRAMVFASHSRLYVGTMNGQVYRYDESGGSWTRTRLDTMGGTASLGLTGIVTDIAVDPADTSGDSIYITFGGSGDYRHVWHFDASSWTQRSGPSAGAGTSLLDVQHTAIACDPGNPSHVFAGADIGVWRSTDGGTSWEPFSEGLPDAGVMDLKVHEGRRLLRVSTHGRGVFERRLDTLPREGVELFIRDTQLDQGRFTTLNWLNDPTDQGEVVRHWRGPDIKLDTPDTGGNYQFPLGGDIDFYQFTEVLTDDFRDVATHATATITTRVYVQVHNRGVVAADGVRVMLLLANASAGLPSLPAGYETNVQNGIPINTTDWRTIGFDTLDDVRPGAPKIAAFDLTSDMLPPPASLAGNDHHCVLALVHHPADTFDETETHTDTLSKTYPKSAHKNLKVVQFTGTVPAPPPIIVPVRLNNGFLEEKMLTNLIITAGGYRGRIRILVPRWDWDERANGHLEEHWLDGQQEDFVVWAKEHMAFIEKNQQSEHPYDKEWCKQRMEDIERAFDGLAFTVSTKGKGIRMNRITIEPNGYHTVFLIIDRPKDGEIGESSLLEVIQTDAKGERVVGGMSTRIDLVGEPKEVVLEEPRVPPSCGVQFRDALGPGETKQFFSQGWPAEWQVQWSVVPVKPYDSAMQVFWYTATSRESADRVTWWVIARNLSNQKIRVEGRYSVTCKGEKPV